MRNPTAFIEPLMMLVAISAIKEFTICPPSEETTTGHYLIFIGDEPEQEIITIFSDQELKAFLDAYLLGWQEAIKKYQFNKKEYVKPEVVELSDEAGRTVFAGVDVGKEGADESVEVVNPYVKYDEWLGLWNWHPQISELHKIVFELESRHLSSDINYPRPQDANDVPRIIVGGITHTYSIETGIVRFIDSDGHGFWCSPLGDIMLFGTMHERTRKVCEEVEHIGNKITRRLLDSIRERGRTVTFEDLRAHPEECLIDGYPATITEAVLDVRIECGEIDQYWMVKDYMQPNFEIKVGKLSLESAVAEVRDIETD